MATSHHASQIRKVKVTVSLPADLIEQAKESPDEGVTETIRRGLENLASRHAQRRLAGMIGKVRIPLTATDIEELRRDRDGV